MILAIFPFSLLKFLYEILARADEIRQHINLCEQILSLIIADIISKRVVENFEFDQNSRNVWFYSFRTNFLKLINIIIGNCWYQNFRRYLKSKVCLEKVKNYKMSRFVQNMIFKIQFSIPRVFHVFSAKLHTRARALACADRFGGLEKLESPKTIRTLHVTYDNCENTKIFILFFSVSLWVWYCLG